MRKSNKAKRNGKGRKKWNHSESCLSAMARNRHGWSQGDNIYYLWLINKISFAEYHRKRLNQILNNNN